MREWNRQPVSYYAKVKELDGGQRLRDFDPLFMYLAVIGISDFFIAGAPLIELLVPSGTDMAKLGKEYEAFVVELITKGVAKRD